MLIHKNKIDWLPQRYISVVMKAGSPRNLVSEVQGIWAQYFADSSFDYFFLDQYFDYQYRQDFVAPVLIMLFISFVTIAFQTLKIIMSKPARSLKYE